MALNSHLGKRDGARQTRSVASSLNGASLLPFYYDHNQTKEYKERWVVSVVSEEDGTWIGEPSRCGLGPEVFGLAIPLEITDRGWRLRNTTEECKGEWDKSGSISGLDV